MAAADQPRAETGGPIQALIRFGVTLRTGTDRNVIALWAITLLLVSIPVLGRWIFRSRADKVQAAATSWGN